MAKEPHDRGHIADLVIEGGGWARVGGQRLRFFGGTDYLGLARHPDLIGEIGAALQREGASASGSRVTTGSRAAHAELEGALGEWTAGEAVILPSGYLAAQAAVQGMAPAGGWEIALLDERAHPCLSDACRAAGIGSIHSYRHADPADFERQLRRLEQPVQKRPERWLVATDAVFPVSGQIAPLDQLAEVAAAHGIGLLLIDDAHGLGVLGPGGAGTAAAFGLRPRPGLCLAGTLSKALGSFGGWVSGPPGSAGLIRSSSVYVGSTPIPAALAAGACVAVRIARSDLERRERVLRLAQRLKHAVRELGMTCPDGPSPIVSLKGPSDITAAQLHARLLSHGCYVPAIRYPGADDSTVLRAAVTADHSEADIELLTASLAAAVRES